jgi:prepilin-type N-terminal cleavage/methylation domain-containing protein
MGNKRPSRGFTLIELAAVVMAAGAMAMALPTCRGKARTQQQLTDATQLRGIHQGMVLWAQNNNDAYPLPSKFDLKDETVTDQGRTKDTTAAIFSMLIFNCFFSPELCVSPKESNTSIKVHDDFAFSEPATAVKPKRALWDPAFVTDFTNGKVGNFSYAHMLPADERLEETWTNSFDATQAAVGNRGRKSLGSM